MKSLAAALALSATVVTLLLGHDLFLKLETFFVPPRTSIRVAVLNGTFTASEAAVTPDRLADLSVVGPDGRRPLSKKAWQPAGDSTWLTMRTGSTGTYVIGASVAPRELTLSAEDFNHYLEEEGLHEVLANRTQRHEHTRPARERYQKHVKAVFQVGATRTTAFSTRLDYAAELVPLTNPYDAGVGDTLAFICLVDGKPVRDQVVLAGGERDGRDRPTVELRSDARGWVRVVLTEPGRWYVKFIQMERVTSGSIDYESKWATLTFEVASGAGP